MIKKILSILLFIALSAGMPAAADNILNIATDPWPPWVIGEEGQIPEGGIAYKVAQELGKRLNVKTKTKIYPFTRALNNTYQGKTDMILMLSRNPEREEKLLFTDSIIDQPYLLFYDSTRNPDFTWNTYEDLRDEKVGIVRSFNYGSEWDNAVKRYNIKTEEVTNDETNLKKLIAGRMKVAVIQKANAQYLINQNKKYQGRIQFAPKIIKTTSFGFAVSKKSPFAKMMPQINKIISEMRMDGTIERIINQETY